MNKFRVGIQPTIAFLITKIKNLDKDDWKKLIRLLRYLKNIKFKDNTKCKECNIRRLKLKCYINLAFIEHADFNNHSCNVSTIGEEASNTIYDIFIFIA